MLEHGADIMENGVSYFGADNRDFGSPSRVADKKIVSEGYQRLPDAPGTHRFVSRIGTVMRHEADRVNEGGIHNHGWTERHGFGKFLRWGCAFKFSAD